eukprot:SAG31_NODE_1711_length_7472_cov_2.107555_9_plen_58_part_00
MDPVSSTAVCSVAKRDPDFEWPLGFSYYDGSSPVNKYWFYMVIFYNIVSQYAVCAFI